MIELLLDTELSDDQRDYAATARSSADSLLSLIDDILDFSKIEARKLRFQISEFSLHTLVHDVSRMMDASTNKRGLRFVSRIDDRVPDRLLGDPVRLRQILVNLLANAVKFTHAGSVSLTVDVDQQDGSQIRLKFAVSDTGIGIPKDRMHHLFEYFSQVDSSSTRRYGGTGLGLAICSQLVEMMHGEIGVESELGKGSTFHFTAVFTIPVAVNDEETAEPAPAPPILTDQQRHDTRILVVEDCTLNQRLILKFLSLQGYQTDLATNGEEAIQALSANDYQLVLMDVQMPTMDGIEAARIIRSPESDVRDHSVPIIALTAHATLQDQRLCLDAGMNDYITKPIKRSRLFAAIDTMLAKRLQRLPGLSAESTPPATRPDDDETPILTVTAGTPSNLS
jgi:CheY-like chemotaxis protein